MWSCFCAYEEKCTKCNFFSNWLKTLNAKTQKKKEKQLQTLCTRLFGLQAGESVHHQRSGQFVALFVNSPCHTASLPFTGFALVCREFSRYVETKFHFYHWKIFYPTSQTENTGKIKKILSGWKKNRWHKCTKDQFEGEEKWIRNNVCRKTAAVKFMRGTQGNVFFTFSLTSPKNRHINPKHWKAKNLKRLL